MSLTALILIDIQNDFCPGGALAVPDGNAVVPIANQLQDAHSIRVLTQDWHPADHSSFAANHPNGEPYTLTQMPYGPQVLWPTHCVQGSTGADFHKELATQSAELILRKGFRRAIDSYSAFFENDHKTPTGLHGYLQERDVSSLVMAGLAMDFCVRFSAVDGAKLGYEVSVVQDGCRAIDLNGSLDEAIRDMVDNGVNLI